MGDDMFRFSYLVLLQNNFLHCELILFWGKESVKIILLYSDVLLKFSVLMSRDVLIMLGAKKHNFLKCSKT